jgi:hypothetical protein
MLATYHAVARAKDRLGFVPCDSDWGQVVLDIVDTISGSRAAAVMQAKLPDGRERWRVALAGREVSVVYCPVDCVIITVMPPGMRLADHLIKRHGIKKG